MDTVLVWIAVVIAVVLAIGRAMDKSAAHKQGLRSQFDETCTYCGKRLKFAPGGSTTGQRKSVCHHCGREQPIMGAQASDEPVLTPRQATGPSIRTPMVSHEPPPAPLGQEAEAIDIAKQLERLAQLHASGALTEPEFIAAKDRVLGHD